MSPVEWKGGGGLPSASGRPQPEHQCQVKSPGLGLTLAMVGLGTKGKLLESHQSDLHSSERAPRERPVLEWVQSNPKPGLSWEDIAASASFGPNPRQGCQNPQ